MKRLAAFFVLSVIPSCGQITWTKVWTGPSSGTPNTYYNGYHDIHYDPYTRKTWIWSTDTTGGAESIYSSRLHYFDDASTDTLIATSNQPSVGNCNPDTATWPGTRHPVGQIWVDQIRHRLWVMQGVCAVVIVPTQHYYSLGSGNTTWTQVFPAHMPVLIQSATTLSADITSAGQTTITVTSGSAIHNGQYIKISTEIMQVTSGGLTSTLTVTRGLLGTSALASVASGTSVSNYSGIFNNVSVVHDTDHDAFILFGFDQGSNAHAMQVYCDTSANPSPGTLTAAQTSVGCANADDWTDITSLVTDNQTHTGASALPSGNYYPNLEYDSVHHQAIGFAGLYGAYNEQNQVWTYEPVSKKWTNVNGLPNPATASFTTVTFSSTPVFDAASGSKFKLTLSGDVTGSTFVHGAQGSTYTFQVCQDSNGQHAFAWPANVVSLGQNTFPKAASNCLQQSFVFDGTLARALAPGNSSANNENGRIAHAFNTIDGKYYYHLTSHTPSTIGSAPAFAPQDWVYDPATNSWTQLSPGGSCSGATQTCGPYLSETMTFDPVCNCLIAWAAHLDTNGNYQASGIAEIWKGQLAAPCKVADLTVQEALYSGGSAGVARTSEPFTAGVPIADAANITSTAGLGLGGATAGQFKILGTWPDGKAKWIKVAGIVPALTAGGTAMATLTCNGAGNFGGPNLATDNGSTITVNTGDAVFTVKKANFNVIDSAVLGGTSVVASSTSPTRGLILTGPDPTAAYPGNVTCGTCTTVYSSANDANSTCSIEENGPVLAAIKCTGNHMDANGNPYMQYTAREYFYTGKTSVKVNVVLRNANWDTSATPSPDRPGNTFDSAYKGMEAYELRISPNITGTLTYTIAKDSGTQTGTLNQAGGTDSVYIYQGQSTLMSSTDATNGNCSTACKNTYTPDSGFQIVNNGSTLVTGTSAQYPAGYADISDANGVGMEIGVYQFAAYWPKSLEFNGGGTDVRVGIWPGENSQPVYQAWPAWSIHDVFLEFHVTRPASLANDFLSFQHYLVARASPAYYNSTRVFPYPIVDAATEDAFYVNLASTLTPALSLSKLCYGGGTTNCTPDRGLSDVNFPLAVYRFYNWGNSGGSNQEEFRWSDLIYRGLQRGQTGRWLNSAHFYRFQAEKAWPHADGTSKTDSTVNHFTWRSRPQAGQSNAELDNSGYPSLTASGCQSSIPSSCTKIDNAAKSFVAFPDALHAHWYGMLDYYFLSGDETIHDALISKKDWYLNPNTYQQGFGGTTVDQSMGYTRALGIDLMSSARFSQFLSATGDSDAAGMLAHGAYNWSTFVKPDVCVSGFPAGCTAPPVTRPASYPDDPMGTSRVRGMHLAAQGRGQGWCPKATGSNYYRIQQVFQTSILQEGLLALRDAESTSSAANWTGQTDYDFATDLIYGMSQWAFHEMFNDDGTSNWQSATGNGLNNGFRYEMAADLANTCGSVPVGTSGTVTTSGTAVTWQSGQDFSSIASGNNFGVNGTVYSVSAVTDSHHLTLSSSAGSNTLPVPYQIGAIYPSAIGSAYAKAGSGFATVASGGSAVSWVSGTQFPLDHSWDGIDIAFGGSNKSTVQSVGDATDLTVSPTVPAATNTGYTINPGVVQVNSNIYDYATLAQACQGCWFNFHAQTVELGGAPGWQRQFNIQIGQLAQHGGGLSWPSDFGTYQLQLLINDINNPSNLLLGDVPFSVQDLGSGNYRLTFTTPAGAGALRIKWSPLTITAINADLGFDNLVTQAFSVDPHTHMTWFGSNTTAEPAPAPGSQQTFTVATGTTGLGAGNFSVKAMAPLFSAPIGGTVFNGVVTLGGTSTVR